MTFDFEKDFEQQVEMISMYQGDIERTTLDGEWTESELQDDIYSDVKTVLNGKDNIKGWIDKNKHKAVYDSDLLKAEYLTEKIKNEVDVVELYNKAYDKHRNDERKLFPIHYYSEELRKIIKKELNNNLVNK